MDHPKVKYVLLQYIDVTIFILLAADNSAIWSPVENFRSADRSKIIEAVSIQKYIVIWFEKKWEKDHGDLCVWTKFVFLPTKRYAVCTDNV